MKLTNKLNFLDRGNPSLNNKVLDLLKLNEFADVNLYSTESVQFLKACANVIFYSAQTVSVVFERLENHVGKGENAAYWHFLLNTQCF